MCTSSAFWLPSACGIAALPRKVPSLMSAIEAFTTATIIALSVSVSVSSAPSLDFKVSTLPWTFSMAPRTRRVCAVAAAHEAAMIAPASANCIGFIILFPLNVDARHHECGGAHSIRQDGPIFRGSGSSRGSRVHGGEKSDCGQSLLRVLPVAGGMAAALCLYGGLLSGSLRRRLASGKQSSREVNDEQNAPTRGGSRRSPRPTASPSPKRCS